MGQNASDTCEIQLEDVVVPAEDRLGEEGQGYRIALANLEGGRIGIASQCVGMARAALEIAVRYAHERKAFGKTIFEHQAVSFRLAEMATNLEAANQLTLHAAALKDAGQPCLTEASMAKLFASEAAERISLRRAADARRRRLYPGLRRGAHLPRRARRQDLRGHQRHPAPGHQPQLDVAQGGVGNRQ